MTRCRVQVGSVINTTNVYLGLTEPLHPAVTNTVNTVRSIQALVALAFGAIIGG